MQPSSRLFNRPDTFLGVCEGIGQEFGFSATYLRAAFALALFWNPVVVVASYLTLGLAVALSRWLFPVADTTALVENGLADRCAVAAENDETPALAAAA